MTVVFPDARTQRAAMADPRIAPFRSVRRRCRGDSLLPFAATGGQAPVQSPKPRNTPAALVGRGAHGKHHSWPLTQMNREAREPLSVHPLRDPGRVRADPQDLETRPFEPPEHRGLGQKCAHLGRQGPVRRQPREQIRVQEWPQLRVVVRQHRRGHPAHQALARRGVEGAGHLARRGLRPRERPEVGGHGEAGHHEDHRPQGRTVRARHADHGRVARVAANIAIAPTNRCERAVERGKR
jgi:hypothetical protein